MLKLTAERAIEDRYEMADEALNASLFTTGNGYIGVRGSFEEYGSIRIQGAYIRGVIDEIIEVMEPFSDNEYMKKYYIDEEKLKDFEYQESVVNNADFLLLRISIDGETFYPWEGRILSWERYIQMHTACLVRKVRWENSKGDITDFVFERFSSFDNDHIYCIKVSITPVNHNKTIHILSGIDTRVKTGGQKITSVLCEEADKNQAFVHMSMGKKFGFETGITSVTEVYPVCPEWTGKSISGLVFSSAEFDAVQGMEYIVEKCVFITSSREEQPIKPYSSFKRYNEYYRAHISEYEKIFGMMDIKICGDEKADAGIRFANYHSAIAAERNDSIHSLAAKGLTGEKYNNFVWWDCEVYQLPIYIYTMPEASKKALMYRRRLLEAARENAKKAGLNGAKYAFCSSVHGNECVWIYARHPFMQIHINADIAWGIINYYTVTGDMEFLKESGMEMLIELCEYWKSRVEKKGESYVINRVTGTDEHHPYVNNDAYTNYLVYFILIKTSEYAKMLGMENNYRDIADALYLPLEDDGLIPQFDGYFNLSRTLEEAKGNDATKFQMKTSGLYHKSQIIKQPDVMLIYSYLNMMPEGSNYAANWDYYEQMCESSSSLSYAPHSICSADNGRMLSAYRYLMNTAYIDVYDMHNCSWQGVHSGCLAGAWYAVFRGIAGIVCREDCIEIDPHMIAWWKGLKFSFYYRNSRFNVDISNGTYMLTTDSEESITIKYRNKLISLNSDNRLSEKVWSVKHSNEQHMQ